MAVSAIAVGNWSTLKSTEISQVNDKPNVDSSTPRAERNSNSQLKW